MVKVPAQSKKGALANVHPVDWAAETLRRECWAQCSAVKTGMDFQTWILWVCNAG
ncbi:MAG: hypothetical protein ACLUD0_05455 [Eubacterium ramulus]